MRTFALECSKSLGNFKLDQYYNPSVVKTVLGYLNALVIILYQPVVSIRHQLFWWHREPRLITVAIPRHLTPDMGGLHARRSRCTIFYYVPCFSHHNSLVAKSLFN